MFKFFNHNNINRPETETTNISEIEKQKEAVLDDTKEVEASEALDFSYNMSPEYDEAFKQYISDSESAQNILVEFLKEGDLDPAEDASIYSFSEGDEVVETPIDGETVEVGQDRNQKSYPRTLLVAGKALSTAALLAVAACDKTSKSTIDLSPSVAVQAGKDKEDNRDEYGGNPYRFTLHFGLGAKTTNESRDLDGKLIRPEVKAVPQTPPQPAPKIEKKDESVQPTPVAPVVTVKNGKELESTSPRKEGPGSEIREYLSSIVPSGDTEYGLINLNDKTEEAQAKGMLRYFPESHVFALEGMRRPSEQGIPVRSLVFYKLHKGMSPKPLAKGMSFRDYTKERKGDLRTFDKGKFHADLRRAISKGNLSESKYNEVTNAFIEANDITLASLKEWIKLSSTQRESVYEKEVRPLEIRTGVIAGGKK